MRRQVPEFLGRFTAIEALIAFAIVGIIVAVVFGGLSSRSQTKKIISGECWATETTRERVPLTDSLYSEKITETLYTCEDESFFWQ